MAILNIFAGIIYACHLSYCQTFPGFLPSTSASLFVKFEDTPLNFSGQSLTAEVIQSAPSVGLQKAAPGQFVLLFIDPDSFSNIETQDALHLIQTDLVSANQTQHVGNSSYVPLTSQTAPAAPYAIPAPPYTNPPKVHRYTLLLFQQPSDLAIPSNFTSFLPLNLSNITNRFPFPVEDFVNTAGLGQPVAANYFDLKNSTAPNVTGPTTSVTLTASLVPSSGTSAPARAAGSVYHHELMTVSWFSALVILAVTWI